MATIEKVSESADYIKAKIDIVPKIGIICGSGLGALAENIFNAVILNYEEIPSFVKSSVAGHKGRLVVGQLGGKNVVCMQGRFHPYEGYPAWVIGFPVRVMKLLGVEQLIITNAAGGINSNFKIGDFMIIKDHISFPIMGGYGSLVGPNDEAFGPRFPSMVNAYDKDLRSLLRQCAGEFNVNMQEGVYCNVTGPSYETIAELNFIRGVGGDAVGMSTAQEVTVARHAGIKVVACSLITNECIMDYDTTRDVCHEEVLETGKLQAAVLVKLIKRLIEVM